MADMQIKKPNTHGEFNAIGISPSLTVNDLEKSLRFYTDGLGFGIEEQYEMDGKVLGIMMKAGNAHLGLSQDDFAKGRDRMKGVGLRFWIPTSQDVYDLAKRVAAKGIKLDEGPAKLEWEADAFTQDHHLQRSGHPRWLNARYLAEPGTAMTSISSRAVSM
jgi:catechol 2,3-dioxygenase-like lactoylglutathione lyase family enzyme